MARIPVTVAVYLGDLDALEEIAGAEARREARWRRARIALIPSRGLTARERADAMRRVRVERTRHRESGELAGTLDLLLAWGARTELARRGWDRQHWDPVPPGAITAGQPWGGRAARPFDARLSVRLPPDLVDTMRCGTHWVSAPAIAELMAWRDRWGQSLDVRLRQAEREGLPERLALVAALGRREPSAKDLRTRDRSYEQIVTVGDVMRGALVHVLQRELPPETDMGPVLPSAY